MLSKRLEQLAEYLQDPIHFADIGSDHAYLPCYVCSRYEHATAIAGEVNQGPFERAKQTVGEYGLADRIEVRKGNGLEVIKEKEVNQITIAGMGGKLIRTILEEGKTKLSGVSRLILQPNIDAQIVRKWLIDHQYQIVAEEIITEDGYIYEVIVSDYQNKSSELSEQELLFGPYLLQEKSEVFLKKWCHEKEKRIKLITQMKQAANLPIEKIRKLEAEIEWIEEVIEDDNR
ncbi:tRNA (adenine(22)-N(1))-methyltransferase [Gracilibacillus saliphilus]|uniref:tRNA (adenine(22)-N(1))-methyltransferase n=1 Tax=Gracilibacillus saliphilus TaxID=543890 RepID=UPI0013D39171|nr:tRNA (adenine(22)-N(1))-methyltransferase TrmK [Gracilibacillus saliphilus]